MDYDRRMPALRRSFSRFLRNESGLDGGSEYIVLLVGLALLAWLAWTVSLWVFVLYTSFVAMAGVEMCVAARKWARLKSTRQSRLGPVPSDTGEAEPLN